MNPASNNDTNSDANEPVDYSQPVAYDTNGRPLYAHPPEQVAQDAPQVVHLARSPEPLAPVISDEIAAKHRISVQKYPFLNLSEGEYVIREVRRHVIGLVPILGFVFFIVLLLVGVVAWYPTFLEESQNASQFPSTIVVGMIATLFGSLFLIGGYISAYVYMSNKFFLTNESVIQEIQHSIFSKHEQTVSLANIEDVSYRQNGIIPHIFNYGSIRLSTEGDETTYRFQYVANPKVQIAILNNAVEAFKNGRPVAED